MTYKPGQSGNPKGRPKGVKDRRVAARELFERHREGLINKAVEKALEGDMAALKLCLERVAPPSKGTAPPVTLDIVDDGTLAGYGQAVLTAISKGEIPPDTGAQVLQALGAQARAVEVDELTKRVEALENNDTTKSN